MDKSSFAGIFIALSGILLGLMLEGGKFAQVLQPTAAIIVFGGTLGAVMLAVSVARGLRGLRNLGAVFFGPLPGPAIAYRRDRRLRHKARKEGIVSLDSDLEAIQDPFLRRL